MLQRLRNDAVVSILGQCSATPRHTTIVTCSARVPGIPEIEMPSVEPFRMDELSLSLTTGPNGYKVTLRDLDIYGASNFTVSDLK